MVISPYGGFSMIFMLTFVVVIIGFIVIFGIIIATVVKRGSQRRMNNSLPVLTVAAKVVAKRTSVNSRMHHNDGLPHSSLMNTTYFATFEVESGDRMELELPGSEYGKLVEGDMGKLTFQGTGYLGFQRVK